jgi:Tfp pilus assembly protein PilX
VPTGAQQPKFLIENLPAVAMPGESINDVQYAAPTTPVTVYRVTAMGQGADSTSTTTIQSIVR